MWVPCVQLPEQLPPSWLKQCKGISASRHHTGCRCESPEGTEGHISQPRCFSPRGCPGGGAASWLPCSSLRSSAKSQPTSKWTMEGDPPAYSFPNFDHLKFDGAYAGFIALGKILSFPQYRRNTRLYQLPLKTQPVLCQAQRKSKLLMLCFARTN